MRIVFVSRYQNEVERGVENYVTELSERLRRNHQVEVLTSIRQLVGTRPDVIYPLNGGTQALFCRIYSWLAGARLLLGGHAGIGRDDRWNLYLRPDLFVAFSRKGYDWAKKIAPGVKITMIPHGVDLKKFGPEIIPQKIELVRPVFITVSHLLPYKRVGETVRAVARLKRGSLLILGDGPEENIVDGLGNELLGKKRYRRLVTSHNYVAGYLTSADVFTLVSGSQEAFGLVYLEALACGLPVVATNDSLRRELVGRAGVLVDDPGDSEEYSAKLAAAAGRKWGRLPRRQAEKFGWEKIATKYSKAFNLLV